MADINHKLDNGIQRPKKELSAAKIAAMEKMKKGREEWLKEKKRCEDAGLPPPLSKNALAKKKKLQIAEENNITMEIKDEPQEEEVVEQEVCEAQEPPAPKPKPQPKKKGKKQVVVNNYYEEVVEEEEESSSEEEEEVINNHYTRLSNNPNPQWKLTDNQRIIRFV